MNMFRWTRQSTQAMEEIWHLRMATIDPERVVMLTKPGSKGLIIHVFGDKKNAETLKKDFGGKITLLSKEIWTGDPQQPRAPISIRGRLRIHSVPQSFENDPEPDRAILLPAGMAFGTGDHATTASCLRLLCDISPTLPIKWTALDAGTGTGVLAIAAEKLGAAKVRAIDYDPRAVKAAKDNLTRNRAQHVNLTKGDLLKWSPGRMRYRIVLANVFSEILRAAAPRIARSVAPGGCLMLSGILRTQETGVLRTFRPLGFKLEAAARRGKWVTLRLRAR